jgi:hypothetical protein
MAAKWRDNQWTGDLVTCQHCGLGDIQPKPMTALGVGFWAFPEHMVLTGETRCLASLSTIPFELYPIEEEEHEG